LVSQRPEVLPPYGIFRERMGQWWNWRRTSGGKRKGLVRGTGQDSNIIATHVDALHLRGDLLRMAAEKRKRKGENLT